MTELIDGCEPLSADGGSVGVLVLHGFTGCPQSVRPLAEAFLNAGFAVEMPLLAGHGTTVDDMITTTWNDWTADAEAAYEKLAARCQRVVVAGLSMGGGLTVWLATRHPEIAAIVCVNPVIGIEDEIAKGAAQLLDAGQDRLPAIAGDIADPDVAEAGYQETPLPPVLSLAAGLAELRPNLGRVSCPMLLFTSPNDHTVPLSNSDELADGVSGEVTRVSLERSYHVATLDYDKDVIISEAVAFATQVTTV